MKKRNILLIGCLSLGLFSCSDDITASNSLEEFSTTLEALQTGVTLSGSLVATTTYFTNNSYTVPDTSRNPVVDTYEYDLTYSYSDTYEGSDRRYYEVVDNKRVYLQGENSYNYDGYARQNYLYYDNVVYNDGLVYDDLGLNYVPFAGSNLINPFRLMNLSDFSIGETEGTFILNSTKSTILFNLLFETLDDVTSDVNAPSATLTETNDNYTLVITSSPYNTTETSEDYNTLYAQIVYVATMNVTEIGTANAQSKMAPEPEKPENAPLAEALENMENNDVIIRRHLIPYVDGVLSVTEECVDIYYDAETQSMYDQVYNYTITNGVPSVPTASDFYLASAPDNDAKGTLLIPYTLSRTVEDGDSTTYIFGDNGGFSSIKSAQLSFTDTIPLLNNASDNYTISPNVFNYNEEDGTYSPTNDNLAYIGTELFIPGFALTNIIASGFTTECKIYLKTINDEYYIDKVVFDYDDMQGQTGQLILTYEDVGNTDIPFNIQLQ